MSTKSEPRLVARTTEEQKEMVELAVSLTGSTVSDLVRSATERAAREIIKDYRVLKLSKRDSEAFIETLKNPPEPNEALKDAAKTHEELIGE